MTPVAAGRSAETRGRVGVTAVAPQRSAQARGRARRRRRLGLTAAWILISVATLFPLYWMLVVAFRSRAELFGNPSLAVNALFLENYQAVLSDPTFTRYFVNSLVVATSNSLLVTACAVGAAYAMSRFKLRGRDNIFFWTLTNRMAPPAAFLLPMFLLMTRVVTFGDWKLFDTRIGLILIYTVFNLPFAIWLLQGLVDAIPTELDEAALVDGASGWQVLWRVIIPILRPGIAVTAILTWIFAWNEYLFAANLTGLHAKTITTTLTEFVTVTGTNWGEMAALATLTIVPGAVLIGYLQRHIIAGLSAGAVKG